ncbi:MAG: YceI family protein [Acidimicrobiia bacterium]
MARYEFVPGESTIALDASSSVHPIHTSTAGLTGFLDLDRQEGELHVPLGELRSGNPLIDRETRRRLDTKRHPEITAVVSTLTKTDEHTYATAGTIEAMGETVEAEGVLTITPDDSLRITGTRSFDVRDWGLQPPKLLMVKVHPDVTAHISLLARPS